MLKRKFSPVSRSHARGMGLVELMVGITVGLFIVAAAATMLVYQIGEHRRLQLEAQIQQDMRGVATSIIHDLRVVGYRGAVQNQIWSPRGNTALPYAPATTPYADTTPFVTTIGASELDFRYSPLGSYNTATAMVFDLSSEQFGFKRDGDTIKYQSGASGWVDITDSTILKITNFTIDYDMQEIDMSEYCELPCSSGASNCPPKQQVATFHIKISATAVHDPSIVRNQEFTTRVRNDRITGNCPT